MLLKQQPIPDRLLYWTSLDSGGDYSEAISDRRWKLVVKHLRAATEKFQNERVDRYRVDLDPSEKTDLAEEHSDRAAAMLSRLQTWHAKM